MPKQSYLWLYVTKDKYELPLIVADTAAELAKKVGTSENAIHSAISHLAKSEHYSCRYRRVYIDGTDKG